MSCHLDEAALLLGEEPYCFEPDEDDCELGERSRHLFRLFVGWVPKQFREVQLQPLFEECGKVQDIIILKDKVSGQARGCAFVSYRTKEEAEAAVAKLDRQVHLPGAPLPLEVRFARSHHYIQAGVGGGKNRQLFFSNASPSLSEAHLTAFFEQFGSVEEINLFRENRTGWSKGCGFVLMASREMALKAITELEMRHGLHKSEGSTESAPSSIAVKWADPDLQLKKKKAVEASNADNRMVFFAKVLRCATEDEVKSLFSQFGSVYDVNQFRAFQGSPTSKGCGLVTMGTHEGAVRAIAELDSKFVWNGMATPMVVKWMDGALQRRRRDMHLAAMRQGLAPSTDTWLQQGTATPPGLMLHSKGTPSASIRAGLGMPPIMGSNPLVDSLITGGSTKNPMAGGFQEEVLEIPPHGCAPDAVKLFIGNIPRSCTEDQLLPFFETIGQVVELVVVRDKLTHESKGSAFVWYASRKHAEISILNFNLRHILPDPSGEQDRPLVVRKAMLRVSKAPLLRTYTPKANAAGQMPTSLADQQHQQHQQHQLHQQHQQHQHQQHQYQHQQQHQQHPHQQYHLMPGQSMLHSGSTRLPAGNLPTQGMPASSLSTQGGMHVNGGATLTSMPPSMGGMNGGSRSGIGRTVNSVPQASAALMPGLMSSQVSGPEAYIQTPTHQGATMGHASYQGGRLVSMQEEPSVQDPSLFEAYGPAAGMAPMGNAYMYTAHPGGGNVHMQPTMAALPAVAPVSLSIAMNEQQITVMNEHMYSIQAMAGAKMHVSSQGQGIYHVIITGPQHQVQMARNLMTSLLSQAGLM